MKNVPDGLIRKSITAQEIHWLTRDKTAEINQTKTGEVRRKKSSEVLSGTIICSNICINGISSRISSEQEVTLREIMDKPLSK